MKRLRQKSGDRRMIASPGGDIIYGRSSWDSHGCMGNGEGGRPAMALGQGGGTSDGARFRVGWRLGLGKWGYIDRRVKARRSYCS